MRVDADLLREKEKVNQKALWRTKGMTVEPATDRAIVVPSYHGVLCMDRLDADRALVVRTDDKGNFDLQALPLP